MPGRRLPDQPVDVVPPPGGPVGEAAAVLGRRPRRRRRSGRRPGTGRSSRRSARRRRRTASRRRASRPGRRRGPRAGRVVVELAAVRHDPVRVPRAGWEATSLVGSVWLATRYGLNQACSSRPRACASATAVPSGSQPGSLPWVPVRYCDQGSYGEGHRASRSAGPGRSPRSGGAATAVSRWASSSARCCRGEPGSRASQCWPRWRHMPRNSGSPAPASVARAAGRARGHAPPRHGAAARPPRTPAATAAPDAPHVAPCAVTSAPLTDRLRAPRHARRR